METSGSVIILRPQLNIVECCLFTNKGHFSQFGDTEHCKAFLWASFGISGTGQVARTPSPIHSLYLPPESSCAVCMGFYHSPFFVSDDGGCSSSPWPQGTSLWRIGNPKDIGDRPLPLSGAASPTFCPCITESYLLDSHDTDNTHAAPREAVDKRQSWEA